MRELTCSVKSDVSDGDSGSSVDDRDHNTWNHILDILAGSRTGPALLKLLRDEEAGACGNHVSLCPGRDDVCHGRIEV